MSLETLAEYTPQAVNKELHLSPDERWRRISRPLIISPNLEALLQREEEMRTLEVDNSNESLIAPSPEFAFGLPPPPRGSRGLRSARSLPSRSNSLVSRCARSVSSPVQSPVSQGCSMINPYINPAPTLEGALHRNRSSFGPTCTAPITITTNVGSSVASHENDGQCGSTQSYVGGALPCSPSDRGVYLFPNDHWSKRQSLANTKHSFGNVVDVRTQNEQGQANEPNPPVPATEHRATSSQNLLSRVRSRGKFVKQAKQGPDMQGKSCDDGRRLSNFGITSTRLLISHGKQSSPFDNFSWTHAPVSTTNNTLIQRRQSLHDRPPDSFMESYANLQSNIDITHSPSFAHSSSSECPHPTATISTFSRPMGSTIPVNPRTEVSATGISADGPDNSRSIRLPPLPPTTNFLDTEERADLVRKSRKLARLFGETPGADAMAQQESGRSTHNLFIRKDILDPSAVSAWQYPLDSRLSEGRRHSLPVSPDDVSLLSVATPIFDNHSSSSTSTSGFAAQTPRPSSAADQGALRLTSPTRPASQFSFHPPFSFMESATDAAPTSPEAGSPSIFPPDSVFETLSINQADEPVEAERKRKRERLAKLHRFLGSHVPANLVLGIDDHEASLPPICPIPFSRMSCFEDDAIHGKARLNRRKSSPATVLSRELKTFERRREELDDREKAINVRRAQKMEKVFGVAPPQTLYHTRQSPSPSVPPTKGVPSHPTVAASFSPSMETPNPLQRNPNRSSYLKPKSKRNNRPSTSESSNNLLPKGQGFFDADDYFNNGKHSFIYNHYQHSLNSLNDIMDRDDKESLAELHQYLSTGNLAAAGFEEFPNAGDRRPSNASSTRSERRRSLPARTSMGSLASEYSTTAPNVDINSFQIRRRSAAKLAQFFGVNYRELITQILESIETGVEQEQQRGTLRAEEAEDLLAKLHNLKFKRQSFV